MWASPVSIASKIVDNHLIVNTIDSISLVIFGENQNALLISVVALGRALRIRVGDFRFA